MTSMCHACKIDNKICATALRSTRTPRTLSRYMNRQNSARRPSPSQFK